MQTSIDLAVGAALTEQYQHETAIIRASYGKRDSQITDAEWQAALGALRKIGKPKSLGMNEYAWRLK